jgi:hypothetical protein
MQRILLSAVLQIAAVSTSVMAWREDQGMEHVRILAVNPVMG